MYKRFVVLCLAAVMLLTVLAGCGGGGNNASSGSGSDEQIALTIWNFEPDHEDVDKEIASMFTAMYPNVEVTIVEKDFEQYFTLLATQFQAGQGPDAFGTLGVSNSTMLDLADEGLLEPLGDYFDVSQYPAWLIRLFTYNGHVYSIPGLFEDYIGVFYNKTVFADNGLSLPKTQAELVTIMDTLLAAGISPFTVPGKDAFGTGIFIDLLANAYAPDWNDEFPEKAVFNDPRFIAVLQMFVDWRDSGYFGTDYAANDEASSIMQLLRGEAGMLAHGNWLTASMEGADIGAFHFQGPNGGDAGVTSPKESYGLSVNSQSAHKDMAIEFAKHYASPEVQQLIGTVGQAVPSSCPAAKDVYTENPILLEFAAGENMGISFFNMGGLVPRKGVDYFTAMTELLQSLLLGSVTPEQCAEQLEGTVDYDSYIK